MRYNGLRTFETDPVSEADAQFVFGHCETLGETNARKAIASNHFSREHRPMAELWLRQQEEARQAKIDLEARLSTRRTELATWLAIVLAVLAIIQPWLMR